jgi:hypothetical protein
MPAIVKFPPVVEEAIERFAPMFRNQPERRHFAEYLTGLLVANKKTVSAINREFAFTTDQSCLNRWLTEVNWDAEKLNEGRIAWLQEDPQTRFHARGAIPIDNVLVDHEGKHIDDVGYFYDHAEQRTKIAHDYLIINYVCPSGVHYPLEFRRFAKQEQCQAKGVEFRDHNQLFRDLVDWAIQHKIPGTFVFDSWFSGADNLEYIQARQCNYVGDLKFNRKLFFKGKLMKAEELAASIPAADRKAVVIDGVQQWYFSACVQVPALTHPTRIVILWERKNGAEAKKILITNRTNWEINRIVSVYRDRWPGTECFHRDGKQCLGMGDCQLRKGRGQSRHLYMVFLAYSILTRQMQQNRFRGSMLQGLTTIGQACMAVLKQTLEQTIEWVIEQTRNPKQDFQRIKVQLALC